jgi:hypothetical protein
MEGYAAMKLVKTTENGDVIRYPYTTSMLLFENPNTSFPDYISNELLANYNVFEVFDTEIPFYNFQQKVVEVNPFLIDGKWYRKWEVFDLSDEEILESKNVLEIEARQKRNTLLVESDWTQIEDVPVDKIAWQEYRQLLRDVTIQPDFPTVIIWPDKPV